MASQHPGQEKKRDSDWASDHPYQPELPFIRRQTSFTPPSLALAGSVIRSMADAMVVVDREQRIQIINPAFTRLWGYTLDEARDRAVHHLLVNHQQEWLENIALTDTKPASQQAKLFTISYRRKDGTTFQGETHVSPVMDEQEAPLGLVCITRNAGIAHQGADNSPRSAKIFLKRLAERAAHLEETNAATHTALDILLKKREEETKTVTEEILIRLKERMEPPLQGLMATALTPMQHCLLSELETNLAEILSAPLDLILSMRIRSLSPAETKVARLIMHGKSTKEIAELMHISPWTVDVHRKHIRKKCGIANEKVNLRTALTSLLK